MSLEQKIEALTAAVEALTMKLASAPVAAPAAKAEAKVEPKAEAPAPAPKAAPKEEPKPVTGKHTKEEMKAMLTKVKEKHGAPAAKAIIKTVGKADKMDDISDPAVIDAVYADAEAKYEEDGI